MKTLILTLLICGLGYAQNLPNTFFTGNGFLWADSLWQDYDSITDSTHLADTVDLNYQYEWLSVTGIDTGSTYTDSIVVEYGVAGYTWTNGRYVRSDTTWNSVPFMKDSTWTDANIIAKSAGTISYFIHIGNYEVLRIRMINAEIVSNKVWKFKAQATRKNTN